MHLNRLAIARGNQSVHVIVAGIVPHTLRAHL